MRLIATFIACAAVIAACGGETKATRVIVQVHSDLEVELASVRVDVGDQQGTKYSEPELFLVPKNRTDSFLLSFAVAPAPGRADGPFLLTATGIDTKGVDRVQRRELVSFAPKTFKTINVWLHQACVDKECPDPNTTCSDTAVLDGTGPCVPVGADSVSAGMVGDASSQWDGTDLGKVTDASIRDADGVTGADASVNGLAEAGPSFEPPHDPASDRRGSDGGTGEDAGERADAVVVAPDSGSCPDGYASTNGGCVDIDECKASNGGCGTLVCVNTPGDFKCQERVIQLAFGWHHYCALLSTRSVKCWGNNDRGQLGDGTTTERTGPTEVLGLTNVAELGAGLDFTCARLSSGEVKCWGHNDTGQLGDGTTNARAFVPVEPVVSGAVELAVGSYTACARLGPGDVRCWGYKFIDGTAALRPMPVSGLSDVAELAVGTGYACARLSSGAVMCWGENPHLELGSAMANSSVPVPVPEVTDAIEIVSTAGHTCARRLSGTVSCWGVNSAGELGNGSLSEFGSTPVMATGITDAVGLCVGVSTSCAVVSSGGAFCWGYNANGQLGDRTMIDRSVPTRVVELSSVATMAAARYKTCAVLTDGTISCWGEGMSFPASMPL